MSAAFCQYLFAKHFPGSNYNDRRGFVFVPLADDVFQAMAHGRLDGGSMMMSSQRDTLQVTMGSLFPQGTFDCTIIALMMKRSHTRNGETEIENA